MNTNPINLFNYPEYDLQVFKHTTDDGKEYVSVFFPTKKFSRTIEIGSNTHIIVGLDK